MSNKPFKFNPFRRATTDGGPSTRPSNGTNARNGAIMLAMVPDRLQLDPPTALTDALTNLLHWCDREQVDFDAALDSARMHHQAER